MKKFEYKIVSMELDKKYKITIDEEGTEAVLTGEGLKGWEAVSTFVKSSLSGYTTPCVLMKRVIPE